MSSRLEFVFQLDFEGKPIDVWPLSLEGFEAWLHFHPEDAEVDPHHMPTYSYFHPETWGDWINP